MKIKYLSLLLLLFVNTLMAQELFEGEILYKLNFHDKTGEMTDEESSQFMGSEQIYYIKDNKYKSVMNGMLGVTQFYTGKDSIYTRMGTSNNLMYTKTDKLKESILSVKEKKSVLKVLGYECDLLEIKTNEGITMYYYNKSIKVNSEDYKNHKYGLWYYCLNKTGGALPLKLSTDVADIKLSIEAKDIKSKKLDLSMFEIPKGLQIVKSPE